MALHIRSHGAPCSCFSKKLCLDYAAGLEESSTGVVPRLQSSVSKTGSCNDMASVDCSSMWWFCCWVPPTGRPISIRGAPVIGRYSVSAIWADADNQPIFIPFHRRARRTSAAGAEWMGKCFSIVRCQNSGTVRAGPNRTLEFP